MTVSFAKGKFDRIEAGNRWPSGGAPILEHGYMPCQGDQILMDYGLFEASPNPDNALASLGLKRGESAGGVAYKLISQCVCDLDKNPTVDQRMKVKGHFNESGGCCCEHHGNTCGHCHQYD